ncbi:hypothetical protein NLU13_5940 [Sarocladium strictum]|uniref:NmrA-like domain-containing protein n=1 Tax=Sarocladium strictum TaxID=5046 RepID=A0AA39L6M6_SARSR|nr:hypothetical protein NLU13_5940 [Sarocladium strictum]
MSLKRLAVVLGATRGQGNSVINALLKTGQYSIRGVTRDASTDEAQRLRERGVEVVSADLDDTSALDHAFSSAQVIFAVTTMYNGEMDREVMQGKNVANSASAVKTLEHFIWSTLPSASTRSGGRIPVPHMDGKAQVDEYIFNSLPALARKTTFYWGGLYAENVHYDPFRPNFLDTAKKYAWIQPVAAHTVVPMVGDHTINTGLFVKSILQKPEKSLPGKYVLGVADWMVHVDMLQQWADILGEKMGERFDPIYVRSDLNTVGQLWPGIGRELGQILRLSEQLGRQAWGKDGITPLTADDLDLRTGTSDGDLVSTRDAIKQLGRNIR